MKKNTLWGGYFKKPQDVMALKVTHIPIYQVKKRMTILSLTNFMNFQDFLWPLWWLPARFLSYDWQQKCKYTAVLTVSNKAGINDSSKF